MSPKVVRSKRGELPKPVVKSGSLGFMPLNSQTVSYLIENHGDLILGYRDTSATMMLKERQKVMLTRPDGKREEFLLKDCFYNGYTDALYRGKLPQVIVAAPNPDEWQTFLTDFIDYVQKTLSMGFFLPKKELRKNDPVQDLIPCFIITGNGLVYNSFIAGLIRHLRELEREHHVLNETIRLQILGRFVRGFPMNEALSLQTAQEQLSLVEVPKRIKIAGGSVETLDTIQSVLSLHSLVTVVENRVQNSVERLELENVLLRFSQVILPALAKGKAFTSIEIQKLGPKIQEGIVTIGRHRQAFEEMESTESLLSSENVITKGKNSEKGMTSPLVEAKLTWGDAITVRGLHQYADALGLSDERQAFEKLSNAIQSSFSER